MKWEKRFDWSRTYKEQRKFCEKKSKKLFGDAKFSAAVTDPDFYDILNYFIKRLNNISIFRCLSSV
jgi:hypothetical protein